MDQKSPCTPIKVPDTVTAKLLTLMHGTYSTMGWSGQLVAKFKNSVSRNGIHFLRSDHQPPPAAHLDRTITDRISQHCLTLRGVGSDPESLRHLHDTQHRTGQTRHTWRWLYRNASCKQSHEDTQGSVPTRSPSTPSHPDQLQQK